jgi:hypothetical protein
MRKVLIVLLILMAVAQIAAGAPFLGNDKVPVMVKLTPLVMTVGAVTSAVMLIKKSPKAFIPYFIGFTGFLAMMIVTFGLASLPSTALGFGVAIFFFLPSVRAPK